MRAISQLNMSRNDFEMEASLRKAAAVCVLATSIFALSAMSLPGDTGFGAAFGSSAAASEPQEASKTAIPVRKPAATPEVTVEKAEPAPEETVAPAEPKKRFSFRRLFRKTESVGETEAGGKEAAKVVPAAEVVKKAKPDNSEVAQLVRHYEAYREDLKLVSAQSVSSEKSVKSVYKRLSSYDEEKLARAWVAYNGSVAASTPEFSKQITKKARQKGTTRFLNSLHKDADNVLRLSTSGSAARSVINNVTAETKQLREIGATFKKVSADLQLARKLSSSPAVNQATTARFINTGAQGRLTLASGSGKLKFTNPSLDPNARPMLSKMLILGAHISTEKTNGKHAQQTASVASNKKGQTCLKWARLNLAQCVAASRDNSELAYCTGRHALNDVADCWSFMTLDGSQT